MFKSAEEAFKIIEDREVRKIKVGRIEYGLARFADELFVFEAACPHMEYDLTRGKVSPAATIVCPWHNYQFRLESGNELEMRCKSLKIKKAFSDSEGRICFRL